MSLSAGQRGIAAGFYSRDRVWGQPIWVGAPDFRRARAIFEEITELDADFEHTQDVREAARMNIIQPVPLIRPGDTILQGKDYDAPDARWEVVCASRRNNPVTQIVSWVVQKIL